MELLENTWKEWIGGGPILRYRAILGRFKAKYDQTAGLMLKYLLNGPFYNKARVT